MMNRGPIMTAVTPRTSTRQTKSAEDLLTESRAHLRRLPPAEAAAAVADDALLIDIRPAAQRAAEGEVPAALIIERNVLEWRLDPSSPARIPQATGHRQPIIIMCQEGYTSSLAAAVLQDMGFIHATDLDGGFAAWAASGLPTVGPAPGMDRQGVDQADTALID